MTDLAQTISIIWLCFTFIAAPIYIIYGIFEAYHNARQCDQGGTDVFMNIMFYVFVRFLVSLAISAGLFAWAYNL